MIIKCSGVVLREYPIGETSKILIVFTYELGKIKIYAKGSRTIKSKIIEGAQLLCLSEFVLYKGKEFYYISQCQIIETFFPLREDIVKLSYACYLAELFEQGVVFYLPEKELLRLFLNVLYKLGKSSMDKKLLKSLFELKMSVILGYMPNLDECSICRKASDLNFFDFEQSGVVCKLCNGTRKNMVIPDDVLTTLRHIAYNTDKKLFQVRIDFAQSHILESVCEKYINRVFGIITKSRKILNMFE